MLHLRCSIRHLLGLLVEPAVLFYPVMLPPGIISNATTNIPRQDLRADLTKVVDHPTATHHQVLARLNWFVPWHVRTSRANPKQESIVAQLCFITDKTRPGHLSSQARTPLVAVVDAAPGTEPGAPPAVEIGFAKGLLGAHRKHVCSAFQIRTDSRGNCKNHTSLHRQFCIIIAIIMYGGSRAILSWRTAL